MKRLLGIELTIEEIAELLTRLEFKCDSSQRQVYESQRLRIAWTLAKAWSVSRMCSKKLRVRYGFDNIPTTTMADALPPQVGNPVHEWEEHLRDLLVALGLQEVVTYRMTSPEREGRVRHAHNEYVRIANPIAPERSVLRRSLLASVLEVAEKNARAESIAMFEVGPIFEPVKN